MKTKILGPAATLLAVVILSGCVVYSIYPFYTLKDVFVDNGLTGQWLDTGPDHVMLKFSEAESNSYSLDYIDHEKTNCFDVHLFQLERNQFLDAGSTGSPQLKALGDNGGLLALPLHLIAKYERKDAQLSLTVMNYEWLNDYLQKHPAALSHMNDSDSTNIALVSLTAETRDLQKFLLDHASDTNAFPSKPTFFLKRQPK